MAVDPGEQIFRHGRIILIYFRHKAVHIDEKVFPGITDLIVAFRQVGDASGDDGEGVAFVGDLLIVKYHDAIAIITEADLHMFMKMEQIGFTEIFRSSDFVQDSKHRTA